MNCARCSKNANRRCEHGVDLAIELIRLQGLIASWKSKAAMARDVAKSNWNNGMSGERTDGRADALEQAATELEYELMTSNQTEPVSLNTRLRQALPDNWNTTDISGDT